MVFGGGWHPNPNDPFGPWIQDPTWTDIGRWWNPGDTGGGDQGTGGTGGGFFNPGGPDPRLRPPTNENEPHLGGGGGGRPVPLRPPGDDPNAPHNVRNHRGDAPHRYHYTDPNPDPIPDAPEPSHPLGGTGGRQPPSRPPPRPASSRTLTQSAAGATIPVTYGHTVVGTDIIHAQVHGSSFYVAFSLGEGPIQSFDHITVDGRHIGSGTVNGRVGLGLSENLDYYLHYGTANQTFDPFLNALDSTHVTGWPGLAYMVIRFKTPTRQIGAYDPTRPKIEIHGKLTRDLRNNVPTTDPLTAVPGAAGVLTGAYHYKFTYKTATYETAGSPPSSRVTLSSQQGSLSAILLGPTGTTARRVYRTKTGVGSEGPYLFAFEIADNTTSTATDNIADSALGDEIPGVQTEFVYSENPIWHRYDLMTNVTFGGGIKDKYIDGGVGKSFCVAADDCDLALTRPNRPAAAPFLSSVTAISRIPAGRYYYTYTNVDTAGIESMESDPDDLLLLGIARMLVASIEVSGGSVVAHRIYRNDGGSGATAPRHFVAEVADGVTAYLDNIPPEALGQGSPIQSSRYTMSLQLRDARSLQEWIDTIDQHFMGYGVYNVGLFQVFVDKAKDVSAMVFTDQGTDANIIDIPVVALKGGSTAPNVFTVSFTDSQRDFNDGSASAETAEVSKRLEDKREKRLSLPGVTSYDQAKRMAVHRLNKEHFADKLITFTATAEAIRCLPGDIVTVSSQVGISNSLVLLHEIEPTKGGMHYRISGEFYSTSTYSDIVQNGTIQVPIIYPNANSTPPAPPAMITRSTGWRYTPPPATGTVFGDVAIGDFAAAFIEDLFNRGIAAGCGGGNYCPTANVTRAQMAVFIIKTFISPSYVPPPANGTVFSDVAVGDFAADFIEDMSIRGLTAGCGGGAYCPTSNVTRGQMVVFLLKAFLGGGYTPPAATGDVFSDVPVSHPFASWIEEAFNRGITAGCGGGNYCPDANVTRAQMAALLLETLLSSGGNGIFWSTPRFYPLVPLTYGASVWSQTDLASYTAANVNDADIGTTAFTALDATDGTLILDLGATSTDWREFGRVDIAFTANLASATWRMKRVEYSDDGSTWSDVPGRTLIAGGQVGDRTATFEWLNPGTHRYWRLHKGIALGDDASVAYSDIQFQTFEPYPYIANFEIYDRRSGSVLWRQPTAETQPWVSPTNFEPYSVTDITVGGYMSLALRMINTQNIASDFLTLTVQNQANTLDPYGFGVIRRQASGVVDFGSMPTVRGLPMQNAVGAFGNYIKNTQFPQNFSQFLVSEYGGVGMGAVGQLTLHTSADTTPLAAGLNSNCSLQKTAGLYMAGTEFAGNYSLGGFLINEGAGLGIPTYHIEFDIINLDTNILTIKHNDLSSTSGARVNCPGGVDYVVGGLYATVRIRYDGLSHFYYIFGGTTGGSGFDTSGFITNTIVEEDKWIAVMNTMKSKMIAYGRSDAFTLAGGGTYNDVTVPETAVSVVSGSAGAVTITGLVNPNGIGYGSEVSIEDDGDGRTYIFKHQDTGSTALSRFILPGGVDLSTGGVTNARVTFRWDMNDQRWRLHSKNFDASGPRTTALVGSGAVGSTGSLASNTSGGTTSVPLTGVSATGSVGTVTP